MPLPTAPVPTGPPRRLRWGLRPDDLLRERTFRRLWTSVLVASLGGQVTLLALPLTAAVLLQATPLQMGWLTAMEIAPFVLLSLPAGVWLDRVRKLPVYLAGELLLALVVTSVPLAWWLGWLTMPWLYGVGFVIGAVSTVAGSAAQIVLTQVVARDRLVEAHARNALASSGAEVAGPGAAGLLIRLVGAPVALLVDSALLLLAALLLRGIRVRETLRPRAPTTTFWRELRGGVRFVAGQRLLVALALAVGLWQMCHHAALVVQILFATRTLGLDEATVGGAYMALGGGTVVASVWGQRLSARIGPGPCLLLGFAVTGTGWTLLAAVPAGPWGVVAFALTLALFGAGAVLVFINFLALRQAVTPAPMLGRMTSTMRWLTLLPAGPGALLGGWLGQHAGLRSVLALAGASCLAMALLAWRHSLLRGVRELPTPAADDDNDAGDLGAEAALPPLPTKG